MNPLFNHRSLGGKSNADSTDAAIPPLAAVSTATDKRAFILQVIQPGLAGLMDGSVSSLAPLFAAALSTRNSHTAFLVGMATAVGAGVSMAFSEALSDDGKLSGRGNPVTRGAVEGAMTFLGAAGHALPYRLPRRHPHREKLIMMGRLRHAARIWSMRTRHRRLPIFIVTSVDTTRRYLP